jgi:DNA transposition AAA+ family ATPase
MTINFGLAINLLQNAQTYSRFLALTGATGNGKTHALKLYARRNANAYYVLCDSEMSKKRFMQAILQAIGVRPDDAGTNNGEMLAAIVRKLNSDNSPLLILDDAGKLNDSMLRVIQIIYDRTENHAGLVIAGTEYLAESVEKKARRNVMGFRELRRRVAYWESLEGISAEDVKSICEKNEVTDEGVIKYLVSNCHDFGTIRNMITNLKAMAKALGQPMSRDMLVNMNSNRRWN